MVAAGAAITSGLPVPIGVESQTSWNHWSVSPEPPTAVSVMVPTLPAQNSLESALMDVGGCGAASTWTLIVALVLWPQEADSQRAK